MPPTAKAHLYDDLLRGWLWLSLNRTLRDFDPNDPDLFKRWLYGGIDDLSTGLTGSS